MFILDTRLIAFQRLVEEKPEVCNCGDKAVSAGKCWHASDEWDVYLYCDVCNKRYKARVEYTDHDLRVIDLKVE